MLGKGTAINALPFRGFPQALFHAGEGLRVLVKPHFRGGNGLYRIENELAEDVPVDVICRDSSEGRAQRQAFFRVGLSELRDQLEIGVFDDYGSRHKGKITLVGVYVKWAKPTHVSCVIWTGGPLNPGFGLSGDVRQLD